MDKAKVVIVSIPFIIYFIFAEEKSYFFIFIGGMSLLALREFHLLFSPWKGIYAPLSMLISVFILVSSTKYNYSVFLLNVEGLLFILFVIILVSSSIWSPKIVAAIFVNNVWLRSILGVIYIVFLLSFCLALFSLNSYYIRYFLLFLFFTVWVTDATAYIGGSLFGKHQIVPSISPYKSLEGYAIGIFMGGILVAIVFYYLFLSNLLSLAQTLFLGVCISISTHIGDLVESGYKRLAKKKDADNWLPGYGGILDTFDGMCFAAPTMFYLLALLNKL